MAKDSFYFSHDYNARTDDKIKKLLRKHNMLGYGVFWAIIEDLYNNANALQVDCDGIAFDLRVQSELVHSVLHDFDLFVFKDGYFGSMSVQKRIDERNIKSKKASISAASRWEKSKSDANAMRTHSEGNAIKERKGKEIKEITIDVNMENFSFSPKQVRHQFIEFMTTENLSKDTLAMSNRTSKQNIEKACISFQTHLVSQGVKPTDIKQDYLSHFKSWVLKRGPAAWTELDPTHEANVRESLKTQTNGNQTTV